MRKRENVKKLQKLIRKTGKGPDILLHFPGVKLVIIAELHGTAGSFLVRIGVFDGYVHIAYPDKINIT